mmetsp:Transcript_5579/g.6422  ORF Transcript_5579/g.6422 Transcript_5579/m.6422 type:complete len:88 (+) Transcript_5579:182-445(+)
MFWQYPLNSRLCREVSFLSGVCLGVTCLGDCMNKILTGGLLCRLRSLMPAEQHDVHASELHLCASQPAVPRGHFQGCTEVTNIISHP